MKKVIIDEKMNYVFITTIIIFFSSLSKCYTCFACTHMSPKPTGAHRILHYIYAIFNIRLKYWLHFTYRPLLKFLYNIKMWAKVVANNSNNNSLNNIIMYSTLNSLFNKFEWNRQMVWIYIRDETLFHILFHQIHRPVVPFK